MHVPMLVVTMAILASSPSGCERKPSAAAPPTALAQASDGNAQQRRSEIGRQLSKICPQPLTADELIELADLVDHHSSEKDVVQMSLRLERFDEESLACRGVKK